MNSSHYFDYKCKSDLTIEEKRSRLIYHNFEDAISDCEYSCIASYIVWGDLYMNKSIRNSIYPIDYDDNDEDKDNSEW